jgi:two-component system alkaline phosphatase synthesis response regulator PhoP
MKTRILVVDDEPDLTGLLKVGLESEGYYTVREVNDPRRAVAAAREFGPDLVVLDVMMPGMDGTDVAARLRADPQLRDTPVVFMTALLAGDEAPLGACESGGNTFLPKSTLLSALMDCIAGKLARPTAVPAGV